MRRRATPGVARLAIAGLAAAGACFEGAVAFAQSQTRGAAEGYVNFGAHLQSSSAFFNANGERVETADLDIAIVPLYAEVGLVDRWLMLTLDLPLYRRNALANDVAGVGGATSGLGDIRLGLWSTLVDGPLRVLAAVQLGLPTGDPSPEGPGEPALDVIAELLPTGDGETDVELVVAVARDVAFHRYPLRHYAKLQAGYWIRTTGFSDAFNYSAELGTQIAAPGWDWLWLVGRVHGSESFADLDDIDTLSAVSIGLGNGVSYTFAGAEALVRLPLGFGLGGRVDVPLRGRLVLDAPAYRLFASYEF